MPITNNTIIDEAKKLGFSLIGFTPVKKLSNEINYYKEWLKNGYNGKMAYLENKLPQREDPTLIFEKTKSVISVGLNYYTGEKHSGLKNKYKISRYAWGKDYHFVIWDKLKLLIEKLKEFDSSFEAVYYVDTGPVLDKVWAVNSGIGWMGKNTNIINKNFGSWFFIANIFCNLEFDEYNEKMQDFCGSCNKCVTSCPTNALVDNYKIDASRCISYLNIENKEEIPNEFLGKFDNWLVGCDICQQVCPWNIKFSQKTEEINFIEGNNVEFGDNELINLTSKEFKEKFKDSPILRPKLKGVIRNLNFNKLSNDRNLFKENESN